MKHSRNNTKIPDRQKEEKIALISKAVSSWYVRRDGKYFDLENLTSPLARPDIQRAAILRIRDEFPDLESRAEITSAVFDRVIEQLHDAPDQSIPTWNGRTECKPGEGEIIWSRGMVSVNVWQEPYYRSLRVPTPLAVHLSRLRHRRRLGAGCFVQAQVVQRMVRKISHKA